MFSRRLQILTGDFFLRLPVISVAEGACSFCCCVRVTSTAGLLPRQGQEPPSAAGPTPAHTALPARRPWQPLWHLLGWGWEDHGVIYTQVEQTRCNQFGFG